MRPDSGSKGGRNRVRPNRNLTLFIIVRAPARRASEPIMRISNHNSVPATAALGGGWQHRIGSRLINVRPPIDPSRVLNLSADSQVFPAHRVQAIDRAWYEP